MLYFILIAIFLLCLGATVSSTLAERSGSIDRPRIYSDERFIKVVNLFIIPTIILFIVLMIINWKITLIITIVSVFLAGKILKPISERLIVVPLFLLLSKDNK